MASNVTTVQPTGSESKDSGVDERLVLALVFLSHGAISVLGTLGNILVFKVILSHNRRKVSEYLILNLCATDLGACAISIPLDLVERAWKSFPFGEFLCNIVYPFQTILMAVSVMTLLAMSYERYRLIVTPFKSHINSKIAICTIVITWLISCLLVLPYMMVLRLDHDDECKERWPQEIYRKAFTLSVFLVLYLIPLIIISVFYALIIKTMYQDSRRRIMECFDSTSADRNAHTRDMMVNRIQRNMRVVKIFMSAGLVFAVCMLPTHLSWLWHDFGSGSNNRHFTKIVTFSNVLMYSNSAIDPFIFGSFKLRKLFLDVSCCRVCRGNQRGTIYRLRTTTKLNMDETTEQEVIHDRVTSL
jgi:hypothetical protein